MTKQTNNEPQFEDARSEILLVVDMDNEYKYVTGMRGVGKYDEFETSPVKSGNLEQFKRFDKNGDFLRDFLVEFFDNMDNPARYRFFIVPESTAVELVGEVEKSLNSPSKEGELILKKYAFQTDHVQERLKFLDESIARQRQQQEKLQTPAKSKGRKM